MLKESFDVHLGCFIDDPFDKRYQTALNDYCVEVFSRDQNKTLAKIKGLTSFITGKPITLPYYFDQSMQQWVNATISRHNIKNVFVYSSSMAQYCQGDKYDHMHRVIDFVDVDSDKWRQYAEKKQGISRWVYQREFQQLSRYEDMICEQFDHSLFVSPDEASLFASRQKQAHQSKIHGVLNGVDIEFFDPDNQFSVETLVPDVPFISFTGAMDYWANIDAVVWFVNEVWPTVIKQCPDAKFVIAGGNPSSQVKLLARRKGVIVTGRVNDVRPFIAQAQCVVAPLRIARGIQNKVLEAMALDKAVVCTSMAMEGINAPATAHVHIEDDALVSAKLCINYLEKPMDGKTGNREWILQHFTWSNTLQPLADYYSDSGEKG